MADEMTPIEKAEAELSSIAASSYGPSYVTASALYVIALLKLAEAKKDAK
ncbi:hypothetical protein H9Y04_06565 [Streptomyces sp. TRM66268-LWL]|uniref:Uncharacterized protein n=1 Tax=Streptomyces polyasparticus TaxID=2767826 RepID=A0ABR7SAQ2_9ACTN|nr:hypothetical protein [Streptomyces polyasparticus]MBC9712234.1 hypothetical protein [Streptomyces polyasparticus]